MCFAYSDVHLRRITDGFHCDLFIVTVMDASDEFLTILLYGQVCFYSSVFV